MISIQRTQYPKSLAILVTGFIVLVSMLLFAQSAKAAPVNIVNNSDWYDTNGNAIWAQGGFMMKKDNTYYWYGMNYEVPNTKKVNLYTSTDLKNWTKQENSVNPDSVVDFGSINTKLDAIGDTTTTRYAPTQWIGRPLAAYNSATSKFVILIEWGNGDGNGRNKMAVFTSSTAAGPFTYEKFIAMPGGYNMGDLGSVFTDTDGSTYITYTIDYNPAWYNSGIQISKLTSDYTGIAEVTKTLQSTGPYKEATTLFKRGSEYIMIASTTNGWTSSQSWCYSATSLSGTWAAPSYCGTSPSSSNSFDTQVDQVLTIEGSSGTSYIYFGDRWNGRFGGSTAVGRNQWYPLTFDANGKPVINGYAQWTLDAAAGTWSTSAPVDITKTYSISNRWPGKALGIVGGSAANSAKLEQRTYSGAAGQSWKFIDAGGGYYNIRNVTSGLNLTLGGSTQNGAQVTQYTPSTSTSQQFSIVAVGGGYFKLVNRASGKVLGNAGSGADGAIIVQEADANEWSQNFSFTAL
ncbi:RICIN domain-containing protein [Paenibacillus pasadenensis]|uniref:RICIN domain-containing protein n=1 Tax=Paenibacillus pasadenensis TaxID=217090 RepID=UPI00203F8737|nr:RICIN domain-containing protein [Paenibacillus pasadenensis]MCM3746894.1 RICIN domain-containing protein [Paenibacillus pasadenensis]